MREGKSYAALEGSAVDIVSVHLADRHGGILVCVHLNESKSTVGLESRLDDEAKVLEQRHNIVGGCVRGEVSDVAGGLPAGGLGQDDFVTSDAMRWELVVSVGSGRGHAHGLHGLLLSHGRLALLVRPVASDGSRAQPFAVHGAQGLLGVRSVPEGDKTVTSRTASLHIPHDTSLRDGTKSREGLEKDLVVDLVGQIADKNVEVVGSILLVCCV